MPFSYSYVFKRGNMALGAARKVVLNDSLTSIKRAEATRVSACNFVLKGLNRTADWYASKHPG